MPRPRQAVRFVLRLLAQVAAGCLIAAAVAWGIVICNPTLSRWTTPHVLMSGPDGRSYFYPQQQHGFGVQAWAITLSGGELPYAPLPTWVTVPESDERETTTSAYGWPLLCMTYHVAARPNSQPSLGTDSWTFSHATNRYFKNLSYTFPLRILPLRFAANAAIYAFLIGAGWPLTAGIRSFIRWRRGSCPNCGYDRRGLTPDANCPECGTVPAR